MQDLIDRVGLYTQDQDHQAWSLDLKRRQLIEEIQRLARQELLGQIIPLQGVLGQSQYTFPDQTTGFADILYDGKSLKHASEQSLTRLKRTWERDSRTPQYWTEELQVPQTVQLVPAPVVTGDATLPTNLLPLLMSERDNVLGFTWEAPTPSAALDVPVPLPELVEDLVVFSAVSHLTGMPGEYADLAKSQVFGTLSLWVLQGILGTI